MFLLSVERRAFWAGWGSSLAQGISGRVRTPAPTRIQGRFHFSRRGRSLTGPRAHTVRPYGGQQTGSVGSETAGAEAKPHQSQFSSRSGPQWGRRNGTQALLILCAGRILPTSRGNPRKWGPGPTPPVRGRWPEGPEGVGWATMSTKCSSGAVPGGVLGNLSRTSRRSPTKWVRREEEEQGTSAVFATRRKRSRVDFATTSRRGQSHSPPAGGETSLQEMKLLYHRPLIRLA